MTIFPPVKPACPWDVQVRAVTVHVHCRRPVLEDDFLPHDHLLFDELDHLVQVPRNLLAMD